MHINYPLEADPDAIPVLAASEALAIIKLCKPTLTQFGCNARVWQVREDVKMYSLAILTVMISRLAEQSKWITIGYFGLNQGFLHMKVPIFQNHFSLYGLSITESRIQILQENYELPAHLCIRISVDFMIAPPGVSNQKGVPGGNTIGLYTSPRLADPQSNSTSVRANGKVVPSQLF